MANREKQRELYEAQRKGANLIAAKEREKAKEREVDWLLLLPAPSISSKVSNHKDFAAVDSDSDPDESAGFGIKADFNTNDAQTISIDDDVDESIEKLIKRELFEPTNPTESPNSA